MSLEFQAKSSNPIKSVTWIGLICTARLVLGSHWLSNILAGLTIGYLGLLQLSLP